ncbi:DNA repair protein RAD5A-like [Rosa chinensis]|uniref:DNA repair protein RAD5A-like n=1 Tax=Rosa chinensis TaxID=74649 RepID=UPI001AD8A403|nr:DNA repair protein RAD5A-like [Rosa chinensis]
MDTILLSISVYINSSMFLKQKQTSLKAASNSTEETVVHPIPTLFQFPTLFQLLGPTPFQKAEFTPGDLYTRKSPLDQKDSSGLCASIVHANKHKNPTRNEDEVENKECISDAEVDTLFSLYYI